MPRTDLRHHVGQTLIMGFDGTAMAPRLSTTLGVMQPGGVILFARNLADPQQTWSLLHEAQRRVDSPLFRCLDLEGGLVDRLRAIIAPAPPLAAVMATGDRRLFRRHGRVIGETARALGFNVDFAPVFDLGFPASQAVLRTRTLSADPLEVTAYAREFLRGLSDARVLGCGKHFPGLGEGQLDSHFELPVIAKPWKRLWNEDLYPYRQLRKEIPFAMVAHAAYPAVTRDRTPASLSSKWLRAILRRKLGFGHIILSDDLDMGGVLVAGDVGQVAIECLRQGADQFLVCQKEESVWAAFDAVLRAAERDRRFARRVEEASRRVQQVKRRWAKALPAPASAPTAAQIEKLRGQLAALHAAVAKAQP